MAELMHSSRSNAKAGPKSWVHSLTGGARLSAQAVNSCCKSADVSCLQVCLCDLMSPHLSCSDLSRAVQLHLTYCVPMRIIRSNN